MYLSETSLFDIVVKQFRFKLNAHAAFFSTFILLQIGALVLAITGSMYSISYDSLSSIRIVELNNTGNVSITLFWAFFLGVTLMTTARQNEAFSLVTTRLSNHFANLLFMLTASLFAGTIAALSSPVLKLFGFLRYGEMVISTPGIMDEPGEFFLRIITAISYVLLFFLIGYTISSLVQVNKFFIGIFIIFFIVFTSSTQNWNGSQYLGHVFTFFAFEQSPLLFLLKISGAVIVLFTISAVITNRLEVRN